MNATRANQPEPPHCPNWCETENRRWSVGVGGTAQTCHCTMRAGHDVDGEPVLVQIERHAFLDGDQVQVHDPMISVDCWGMLDLTNAARLAAVVGEATALAG